MSPEQFALVEAHLVGCANRLLADHGLPALSVALQTYLLAPGKRIRPQLTIWAYQHCSAPGAAVGGNLPASVLDLACVWELFHAFLLAHDDIIDGSDTRRGSPALHRRLAELDSGSPIFGAHLAIVGGDLLFTVALDLLHSIDFPPSQYRAILQLFSRTATTTGFGQAIDIVQGHVPLGSVDEELLMREYHWKTAAYTFEGPMVSGALAAGATEAEIAALSRFALSLGQAYQLQNDLLDLAAPAHVGSDLAQGKRTVTLCRARGLLPATDRLAFDEQLHAATAGNLQVAERLRRQIVASSATASTRALVAQLVEQAQDAISSPTLPDPMRSAGRRLLGDLAPYFK